MADAMGESAAVRMSAMAILRAAILAFCLVAAWVVIRSAEAHAHGVSQGVVGLR